MQAWDTKRALGDIARLQLAASIRPADILYFNPKGSIVKRSYKVAAAVAAALGIGVAAAAFAHPGAMGGGMGPGMMHGSFAGPMAAQQLMTPEERTALQEKMRNAKTPEERQKLAEANRTEMQKRAKDKGITLPEPHGPHAGFGPGFGPGFEGPSQ
jgi:hypothetical protein